MSSSFARVLALSVLAAALSAACGTSRAPAAHSDEGHPPPLGYGPSEQQCLGEPHVDPNALIVPAPSSAMAPSTALSATEKTYVQEALDAERLGDPTRALASLLRVAPEHRNAPFVLLVARQQLAIGLYAEAMANARTSALLATKTEAANAPRIVREAERIEAAAKAQTATVTIVFAGDAHPFAIDGEVRERRGAPTTGATGATGATSATTSGAPAGSETTTMNPGRRELRLFIDEHHGGGRCIEQHVDVVAGDSLEIRVENDTVRVSRAVR